MNTGYRRRVVAALLVLSGVAAFATGAALVNMARGVWADHRSHTPAPVIEVTR